jgi:hypothetical protein
MLTTEHQHPHKHSFANPCLNPGAPSSCFTTAWETPESDIPWPTASSSTGSSSTSSATATAPTLPAWTDPASLPRAPGTRENCASYDIVYDDEPPVSYGNPNACWWRANMWGSKLKDPVASLPRGSDEGDADFLLSWVVTHEQLMEWNPSLKYDVADDSTWNTCQFEAGYSYCVKA